MADEISTSDCTVSHISQWLCSTSARNITKTIRVSLYSLITLWECHNRSAVPISACSAPWAMRLLSQWMLHWWQTNEVFPRTHSLTSNTRLNRPQLPFFKSSVWPLTGIWTYSTTFSGARSISLTRYISRFILAVKMGLCLHRLNCNS